MGRGRARSEYAHTVVLWRLFWLQSISTLPGVQLMLGPRTVRARPVTCLYASVKIMYARHSGTSK